MQIIAAPRPYILLLILSINTVKYADDLMLLAKEETVLQSMSDRVI
jgi:hypothetical protein